MTMMWEFRCSELSNIFVYIYIYTMNRRSSTFTRSGNLLSVCLRFSILYRQLPTRIGTMGAIAFNGSYFNKNSKFRLHSCALSTIASASYCEDTVSMPETFYCEIIHNRLFTFRLDFLYDILIWLGSPVSPKQCDNYERVSGLSDNS